MYLVFNISIKDIRFFIFFNMGSFSEKMAHSKTKKRLDNQKKSTKLNVFRANKKKFKSKTIYYTDSEYDQYSPENLPTHSYFHRFRVYSQYFDKFIRCY